MKIGLDVHGVINKFPCILKDLSHFWHEQGHEIHIVTGQEWENVKPEVASFGIHYDFIYSIVDHHLKQGTKMWNDDHRGSGWWMDVEDWKPSKGIYAKEAGLDVHFDDEIEYAHYFPKSCAFILVGDSIHNLARLLEFPEVIPLD